MLGLGLGLSSLFASFEIHLFLPSILVTVRLASQPFDLLWLFSKKNGRPL
jgi:hypothetical protein